MKKINKWYPILFILGMLVGLLGSYVLLYLVYL